MLELSIRVSRAEECRAAAREILAKVTPDQWGLAVCLATEILALAEAVDQTAEVYFEVRRKAD